MKNSVIIVTLMLLALNVALGFLITGYPILNVVLTSSILLLNGGLALAVCYMKWKTAFRIAWFNILPVLTVCELVLGCLAPKEFHDSWCYGGLIVCYIIELLLFAMMSIVSSLNKD